MLNFCIEINHTLESRANFKYNFNKHNLTINSNQPIELIEDGENKSIILGSLVGKNISDIKWNSLTEDQIRNEIEGEFVVVRYSPESGWKIFQDQFSRMDLYFHEPAQGQMIISNTLEALKGFIKEYDPAGIASYLIVYGYRTPKKDTIYKNIKRLGVGEFFQVKSNQISCGNFEIKLRETVEYTEKDLEKYSEALLGAVEKRSSDVGNIVLLSSGWDSSALLSVLVKLKGADKVKAVTGRIVYSKRAVELNSFEITRAKQIADHFGVKHEVVDLDFNSHGLENFKEISEVMKNGHVWGVTAVNWWCLLRHVNKTKKEGEVVFSGEVSDGAHNLGFSQFVTIFHPDQNFREYSDKMMSYLFGPSFTSDLIKGETSKNFVYNALKERMGAIKFETVGKSKKDVIRNQLESMFVTGSRFPGYSIYNNKLLTEKGCSRYMNEMKKYFEPYLDITDEKNLYAAYLSLYNSFHWQSGTVGSLKILAEHAGFKMALPFWDSKVQDFLATMPESFGRGLDLNPTKYPLKHFLKNTVKNYPFDLQIGPHSYLYDVEEGFSLGREFLCFSQLTESFKKFFKNKEYLKFLSEEYFNQDYFNATAAKFVADEKLDNGEVELLLRLASLHATGTY